MIIPKKGFFFYNKMLVFSVRKSIFYLFFFIFINTSYLSSDELEKYIIINEKLFGLEYQGISDNSNIENLAYLSTKNKSRERLVLQDSSIANERDKLWIW